MADPVTAAAVNAYLGKKINDAQTSIESDIAGVDTKIDTVDGLIDSLHTKIDTIDSLIDTLTTKVDTVDSLIDTLTAKLTPSATNSLHFGTSIVITSSDTTILNLSSTAGKLIGINLVSARTSADAIIDTIKYTKNGGSEVTLSGNFFQYTFNNSSGEYSGSHFIPMPINFDTSLLLKMKQSGSASSIITATAVYEVV